MFASNGDGFVFHDKTLKDGEGDIEKTLTLDEFPSPAQLWEKYRAFKGLSPEEERIVLQDYHDDGAGKEPRYYQANAINATVEAIAKGVDRNLLVMATGTGKTYTAFQIIWRLWTLRGSAALHGAVHQLNRPQALHHRYGAAEDESSEDE